MNIKVDEDLPRRVVDLLREKGYQADSVIDQGYAGWKDAPLWEEIQNESRLLITADKGFANIRTYPPGTHAGVILLRPDQDGIRPIVELIESVLENHDLNTFSGTTAVVTRSSIRVRKN